MTQILYTIGEIYRLGLLKNQSGEPYTNKGTVSNVLSRYQPDDFKDTAHGKAKLFGESTIDKINKRWD